MHGINNKPNILIVTGFLPYPLNVGGKIRIYALCKLLADKFNFILLSLIQDKSELGYDGELSKLFKERYLINERSQCKNLLFPSAYAGSYSNSLIKKFTEIINSCRIDLIHIEFNELLYLSNFAQSIPVIYTEHDISALSFYKSYYRPVDSIIMRFFDHLKKLRFYKEFYQKVDKILAVSENDKRLIQCFMNEGDISLLPTGVDLEYFSFKREINNDGKLIFIGWFGHYPNEDAVLYFVNKIFPLVKRVMPAVQFLIIGANINERIQQLKNVEGVKIIGAVNDVRTYLSESSIFVNPIRLGGGIKGKIIEAMAMGIPVVSTKIGCSGVMVEEQKNILIANKPQEFAKQIIRLFREPDLSKRIRENARELIEKHYDWEKIAVNLDKIYGNTMIKLAVKNTIKYS